MKIQTEILIKNILTSTFESLAVSIAVGGLERGAFSQMGEDAYLAVAASAAVPYSAGEFVTFVVLLYLFYFLNRDGGENGPTERIISAAISLCIVSNEAVYDGGTLAVTAASPIALLYTAVSLAGWYIAVGLVIRLAELIITLLYRKTAAIDSFYNFVFGGRKKLKIAALLFVCYLPFALIRFPAGIEFDAYHQMLEFLGYEPMTTHWPPASSALMGVFVAAGRAVFHSDVPGVFAFVLFQMCVLSAVLSYAIVTADELGAPKWGLLGAIFVCAVVPVYPGFAASVVKDTMFSAMVLLCLVLFVRYLYFDERDNRSMCVIFCSALFMAMLRSNGIYLLIPVFGLCAAATARKRCKYHWPLCVALALAILCYFAYSSLLLPAVGVKRYPTQTGEALSVPFQQAAAVLKYAPEDVSEEEMKAIGEVIDAKAAPGLYDKTLSDPVKATYIQGGKMGSFLKAWASLGRRHPVIYLDALLNLNGGFIYPAVKQENCVNSGMYRTFWPDEGELKFTPPGFLIPFRSAVMGYALIMENLPVTYPFGAPSINIFVAFSIFLYAIMRRDKRLIFISVPSVVSAAVCMASPTYLHNGARYALPIIYGNIILVLVWLSALKKNEK